MAIESIEIVDLPMILHDDVPVRYVNVYKRVHGGFLSHGGTPSFNPAIRLGFSMK
jgi:hypothetical protein